MNENQSIQLKPLAMESWEDMERMAKQVAASGMFGVNSPAQAICLFAIAMSEGIPPLAVLKKYHVIEGKPSMRADAMLAEFKRAGGGVIYHIRTDKVVAATYFNDKTKIDEAAEKRSHRRMEIYLSLDMDEEMSPKDRKNLYLELVKLNREGEQTIVRTYADAEKKGITLGKDNKTKSNWYRTPRAMLAARCDTEGIRIVKPEIIVGVMETTEAIEVVELEREQRTAEEPEWETLEKIETMSKAALREPNVAKRREMQAQVAEMRIDLEERSQSIQTGGTEIIETQAEPILEQEDEYRLKYAGGLYKGAKLSDIDPEEIDLIRDTLERKAKKNPSILKEIEAIDRYLETQHQPEPKPENL